MATAERKRVLRISQQRQCLTVRAWMIGLRHEGLFCALFVFFGKLAAGLGLAGSSLMLEFAGFNSEFGAEQPPSVAFTLRILVGLVPMVLVCISASLLYFYPITEARRQNTRR